MPPDDHSDELRAENRRLRAANEALEARLAAIGDAMLEMARRLDGYEHPEPEIVEERREWVGTVRWNGPAAAYEANSGAINHELAQQISRMFTDAELAPIHPQTAEIGPRKAKYALQEAIEVTEAARSEDAPEGP